jgi:hypothetical protein
MKPDVLKRPQFGKIGAGVVRRNPNRNLAFATRSQVQIDDGGGAVIGAVQMQLLFWGSNWKGTPMTTSDDVIKATEQILVSPYTRSLAQYRNIGSGAVVGKAVITTSEPPSTFVRDDVEDFLRTALDNNIIVRPGPSNSELYTVIMPPGIRYSESLLGEHTYFPYQAGSSPSQTRNIHYAWVLNDRSLDSITSILSHELVEACTDPEGDAFQILPRDAMSWNEIGDTGCGCEGDDVRLKLSGLLVQKYWSQADHACAAPGA